MKAATILDFPQTSTRRLGLQAIRESKQRHKIQAKTAILLQLATRAHEKGVSLFEYLTDFASEDVHAS